MFIINNHKEKFVLLRSPDGSSILTNSEDKKLRIFNIKTDQTDQNIELHKVSQMKEGGTIYDYVWYPHAVQKSEKVNLLVNVFKFNHQILLFLNYYSQKFMLII